MTQNDRILLGFFKTKRHDFERVQTFIKLKNIKVILNDGTNLNYGSNNFEVNIFNPNGSGILLENEDFEIQPIEIFPNPTTHLLNVKLPKTSSVDFSIFDIYGKNIFNKKENSIQESVLNIEHLPNGIYFLKIKVEGTEQTYKFIKS